MRGDSPGGDHKPGFCAGPIPITSSTVPLSCPSGGGLVVILTISLSIELGVEYNLNLSF